MARRRIDVVETFEEPDARILETRALALLLLEEPGAAQVEIDALLGQGLIPGEIYSEILALAREMGVSTR